MAYGSMQQSGCSGDGQKGAAKMSVAAAGAAKVSGGAAMKGGPKAGPREQQSGSRGG